MSACELCAGVGLASCDFCESCGYHHRPESGHARANFRRAKYRCCSCAAEFSGRAGPSQDDHRPTACPLCRSTYVEWVDFSLDKRKSRR